MLRRLRAAGHGGTAAPLFLFDAGYSAAALTDGLRAARPTSWSGSPPARCSTPSPSPGPASTAARRAAARRCTAWSPRTSPLPRRQRAAGPEEALPPNPEPDEALVLPDTPLYGTVRAEAWHGVHPSSTATAAGSPGGTKLPVLRGTLVHVTVERLPDGRDPHRAMWLWHAGPGPLSLDELWRAYLARFDIEHAFKLLKGTLGLTAAKVRTPEQADRWVRLVMAAARPAPARPAPRRRPAPPLGETPCPGRPLTPGRVRRGFPTSAPTSAPRRACPKPSRPGPGRPKGSRSAPAQRHRLTAKTSIHNEPDTPAAA